MCCVLPVNCCDSNRATPCPVCCHRLACYVFRRLAGKRVRDVACVCLFTGCESTDRVYKCCGARPQCYGQSAVDTGMLVFCAATYAVLHDVAR